MFSSATTNRGLPQMRVIIHVVGAGTSLAIALIGYALYFASTGTAEQSRRAGMAADRAILDQRDAIVLRQKQLRGDRESMQQRLRELTAMIPDAPEESRFLAQVSELAQKTQLEIDNFRPGRPEDSNHVRRIRVQMTGQASYECLCRFLDGLHGLPRLTQVSRMMIEPATAAGTYPIEMEISIFFAADNAKEEHAKVAQR